MRANFGYIMHRCRYNRMYTLMLLIYNFDLIFEGLSLKESEPN